jgi:2-polyprenyl-3-methyl-5-hydroxy-6-metoxy-1,4-benzoquinol methylase
VNFVLGYVHDLPLPSSVESDSLSVAPFDAATSMFVLHHCPDDESPQGKLFHLRAIAQRMKPGAKFFLVKIIASGLMKH